MTDMETTALKEKFTYNSQEEGAQRATQDHMGKYQPWSGRRWKGTSFYCGFYRKGSVGQSKHLGLAGLNNFSGLWAIGVVPSCLMSGPGWFRAGEILAW